jgi:hypothetical protein
MLAKLLEARMTRLIARLAAGLSVCLLAAVTPASAAFEMKRAINIAQWFTWPRYEATGSGIMWPPYKETPRPPSAAELKELKQAGFDTVRLPVDPAPFMVFEGSRREAVYKMLFDAVARIHGAGLKALIDLHPNSRHAVWGQNAVVAGLESPTFLAFNNAVAEMARRLSTLDPERTALELINEPRLKCKGAEQQLWQQMMERLVQRARAAAPRLTLMATGACISTPEGLMALDARAIGDRNTMYTFHFYEPFTFTHQGAQFIPWPDKYLDEVPWPPSARPIEQPLARLNEHVAKVANLDEAAREKAKAGARINLEKLYASKAGPELIEKRFADVARWASQHGIQASQILVGEFGVWRKHANLPGARCEDRMRWLTQVREASERHGFAWAYFNYDGPFAIVLDDRTRELDPAVLASLGLSQKGACPASG